MGVQRTWYLSVYRIKKLYIVNWELVPQTTTNDEAPRLWYRTPRPRGRIARLRPATLRRWRLTARFSPTLYVWIGWSLVRFFYPHAPFQTTPLQLHMCALPCFDTLLLAGARQVVAGGQPHLVRLLHGPDRRRDPVRNPGRRRHHHLPHVGRKHFSPRTTRGAAICRF